MKCATVPKSKLFRKLNTALDDGRIVIHFILTGRLLIYDPRTNTSAQLEMRQVNVLAMYTGNLLTLQVGDMV